MYKRVGKKREASHGRRRSEHKRGQRGGGKILPAGLGERVKT